MRRGAWGVALLALLSVVLAVVITTASTTPILRSPEVTSGPTTPTATPTPGVASATPSKAAPEPEQASELPRGLWLVLYGLLLVMAGLLLWLLWGSVERRRRRRRTPGFAPSDLDAFDVDLERRLVDVVQAQLADLASGTPRNAVVACWLALQEAVGDTGLYRDPAMTSAEFTQEVLGAFALDEDAIRRLSALYREARFSSHAITEQHRDAAAGALLTLSAELRDRASRRPRDQEPAP